MKVVYILPSLGIYGGVISVLQLAEQLSDQGISATVATCGKVDPLVYRQVAFKPFVAENRQQLIKDFPQCDVVVATHWKTVELALAVQQPGRRLVYFVQDFEPDFYPIWDAHHAAAERTSSGADRCHAMDASCTMSSASDTDPVMR